MHAEPVLPIGKPGLKKGSDLPKVKHKEAAGPGSQPRASVTLSPDFHHLTHHPEAGLSFSWIWEAWGLSLSQEKRLSRGTIDAAIY